MATTLETLVTRKQQLESDLKQLEKHIFDLETAYLEEPGNITNNWEVWSVLIKYSCVKIIKVAKLGLQGLLTGQTRGPGRQAHQIKNSQRIFSSSSVSAPKVSVPLELFSKTT